MIITTQECINGCCELLTYRTLGGESSGAVFTTCNKSINEYELRGRRVVGVLLD